MSERQLRQPAGREAAPPTIADPASPIPPLVDSGILLPPQWVRDRGLTVGGPIEVEELPDGSLLLRPALADARPATFTVPVSPERPGEHLFRELVAAYLGGATEFAIVEPRGLRPETREIVRAFSERTGSPHIVSEDGGVLLLEEHANGSDEPLPDQLRRMYRSVRELQQLAGGYLLSDGAADPSSLAGKDDEIDRQAWRVERSLVLRLDRETPGGVEGSIRLDPISPILIARALERTADHAVVLGEHAARLSACSVPTSVCASLSTYHAQALEYLDQAFAVTESPEVQRANELLDTGAALHATHGSLTESFLVRGPSSDLTPLASSDLGLVLQSIDRTVAYAEDLVEVGLDRAVASTLARGSASGLRSRDVAPRTLALPRGGARRPTRASPEPA